MIQPTGDGTCTPRCTYCDKPNGCFGHGVPYIDVQVQLCKEHEDLINSKPDDERKALLTKLYYWRLNKMKKIMAMLAMVLAFTANNATALETGLIFGGATVHHSAKFAPDGGYNWNNQTIGIELMQDDEGLNFGLSVARFKDSFNKRSVWAMALVEYREKFEMINFGTGLGIGHLKTSYYNGAMVAPYMRLGHNDTGLYTKLIVQPFNNDKADSFTSIMFGVSKKFDLPRG